jgi:hypothetical protein
MGAREKPNEIALLRFKKVAAGSGGEPAAREPGLGDGEGGNVTGLAMLLVSNDSDQRAAAVAPAGRGSPSATHALGSLCDWRFTKR